MDPKINIEKYRMALTAKAAELVDTIGNRGQITIEYSAEETEQMVLAASREITIASLDRDCQLLREVRAALARIREGTYGVCERCGDPVKPRRLEAIPWARYCVRCQERIEEAKWEEREPGLHAALDTTVAA